MVTAGLIRTMSVNVPNATPVYVRMPDGGIALVERITAHSDGLLIHLIDEVPPVPTPAPEPEPPPVRNDPPREKPAATIDYSHFIPGAFHRGSGH